MSLMSEISLSTVHILSQETHFGEIQGSTQVYSGKEMIDWEVLTIILPYFSPRDKLKIPTLLRVETLPAGMKVLIIIFYVYAVIIIYGEHSQF